MQARFIFKALAILLMALIILKGISAFISEIGLHTHRMELKYQTQTGADSTTTSPVDAYVRLERACMFSPANADIHFQIGRLLHRQALKDFSDETMELAQKVAQKFEANVPNSAGKAIDLLLTEAQNEYHQAARYNRTVGQARFWSLMIDINKRQIKKQNFTLEELNKLLPEFEVALAADRRSADLYGYMADLFVDVGAPEESLKYYKKSLDISPAKLEEAIDNLLPFDNGEDLIGAILPDNPIYLSILANHLLQRWRVKGAYHYWKKYREELNLPISAKNPTTNLVMNGDFESELDSTFPFWQIIDSADVKVTREKGSGTNGSWSLRADLSLGPWNWIHVLQYVQIPPSKKIRVTAKVRAEGFGPFDRVGIELVHPFDYRVLAVKDMCVPGVLDFQGSEQLEYVRACGRYYMDLAFDVELPDYLQLVQIRLIKYNVVQNPDAPGVVWFDDIKMEPIQDNAPAKEKSSQSDLKTEQLMPEGGG